ncbi:acetate kinase [Synchytrium endobioticum]|uniref:Probable acetate kinase n=1 Tax=Synchytrium endobioticum TaxID=286115 RepID=A0A507DAK4_9FUNG|nr:acetate kinase [Synchytrium endobioticum]
MRHRSNGTRLPVSRPVASQASVLRVTTRARMHQPKGEYMRNMARAENDPRHILTLNAGSSTIKWKLYSASTLKPVAFGSIEALLSDSPKISVSLTSPRSDNISQALWDRKPDSDADNNYEVIFRAFLDRVKSKLLFDHVICISHRVVHGATTFTAPTKLNDQVIAGIQKISDLAPLHNPPALSLIHATTSIFRNTPQIAVFDTSFHHCIPEHAKNYALPYDKCQQLGIFRYGFHGTSHEYLCKRTTEYLDGLGSIKKPYRIITLHLGNGASACAALDGRSVDTSMGLTPLEGLIMGTRSGDVDASAIFHLSKPHFAAHASPEYDNIRISQAEDILNHASGLKGICGESDFKRIEEILSSPPSKDPGQGTRSNSKTDKLEKYRRTELAIKMFCYRIAKYVASYIVPLGGLPHAIVFSGGIGEHVPRVRRMTCEFLEGLVVKIDESTNDSPGEGDLVDITGKLSLCRVFIVKTDEEGELARHAKAFVD